MRKQTPPDPDAQPIAPNDADFSQLANEKSPGIVAELIDFLRDNKKWWLIPIIVALLLIGVLIVLGGTAAAPFIYTLF